MKAPTDYPGFWVVLVLFIVAFVGVVATSF